MTELITFAFSLFLISLIIFNPIFFLISDKNKYFKNISNIITLLIYFLYF